MCVQPIDKVKVHLPKPMEQGGNFISNNENKTILHIDLEKMFK